MSCLQMLPRDKSNANRRKKTWYHSRILKQKKAWLYLGGGFSDVFGPQVSGPAEPLREVFFHHNDASKMSYWIEKRCGNLRYPPLCNRSRVAAFHLLKGEGSKKNSCSFVSRPCQGNDWANIIKTFCELPIATVFFGPDRSQPTLLPTVTRAILFDGRLRVNIFQ